MIPHDPQAERDLIGAMLLNSRARERVLDICTADDLWLPATRAAFTAIADLYAEGHAIDVTTVAARSDVPRNELMRWQAETPASANAQAYAAIVAEHATRRRALDTANALRVEAIDGSVESILEIATSAAERIAAQHTTVQPAQELDEFLAQPLERRWLIPDLLERGDRVIIVGAEGTGKSTLVQQFAVCAASGIHPWTRTPITPLRVLLVDLENPATIMVRNLERLRALAGERYRGNLFVERRPQGMDLTSRRDVRWLDALVAWHTPDLLIVAPLYKAFAGAPGRSKASEEAAELCAQALDEIRVRRDCALLIEAHAGHGAAGDRDGWRPIGSSLWLRWPEFGFGLRPVSVAPREVTLVRWRGDRDVGRDWPVSLVEGHPGLWPWEATGTARMSA